MPLRARTTNRASMERVDIDEKLAATVYRHPFGIVFLYVQVVLGLAASSALIYFILPEFISREDYPEVYRWIGLGLLVVVAFMALILFVATVIYHESRLIITDKTITEVAQEGLFNRKISQLTLGNIEDVTADRKGFVQTLLNFGTLNVQTAGETENFYFHYCPEPDHYAKVILELREGFLSLHGHEEEEARAFAARSNYPQQPQYQPYQSGPYSGQPQQQYYGSPPPRGYYQQPMPSDTPAEIAQAQNYENQYQRPPVPPAPQAPQPTPETDYRGPA